MYIQGTASAHRRATFSRHKFALPLVVFGVGAALSFALAVAARQEVARGAQERFDAIASDLARKVEGRFDDYVAVLVGLRARFNTSEPVTRSDFRDYVAGLNLSQTYPGFQAVNYAPYITTGDRQQFEEQVRGDKSLDDKVASRFAIKPGGERAGYYPLTFIEPMAGNEALLGNDLGAMPNRGNALEQARDTGGLVSSGRKVRMPGRESEVGLAMRLPVYRPHLPLDTQEARRAAYLGSVGAGFSVAEMMRDVTARSPKSTLRLRLIDAGSSRGSVGSRVEARFVEATDQGDQQLLFDSASGATLAVDPGAPPSHRFQRTLGFELGGHAWVVEVDEDESQIIGRLDMAMPGLFVLAGLAISTLLAAIVYSLNTSRSRAQALAADMTSNLCTSERQLGEAQRLANLGSWTLDPQSGALQCSDEARRILGFESAPVMPNLPMLLSRVPSEERATVEQQFSEASRCQARTEFEHHLCLPDGTERWLHVIMQLSEENGNTLLRGAVRDDTRRRKSEQRLKLEHEIARLLLSDGDGALVISQALQAVCTYLRWDCAALWSVDDDGRVRCSSAWHADDDRALEEFARLSRGLEYRPDEGSLGQAWALGDAVRIDRLAYRTDFTRDALAGQAGLAVGLVVPMFAPGAKAALEFFSRNPHAADTEAVESLRVIGLQIAQYEQRKQAERRLLFVASHDPLTGLSNRASLQRELERAIVRSGRNRKRFAVMFIDLDRFKHINDTLGHGVGDLMIKVCGERLSALLRDEDTVARFGGDEFVLLVEGLSNASDAAIVAEKALAACAQPFVLEGRELHVGASIGVSIYPEDGQDSEALLKNADTAMYRAKEKGGGTFRFYAAQMNAEGTERLMLETGLRRALERDELELHYQPKMNLRTRRIVGMEALMRWRHPALGLISPVQFIPIAEETGLIEAMGKWALERACADAAAWRESGLPPVQMSVNLSPRQLNSRSLLADIGSILDASGMQPSLLELEITEGAMMNNPEHAATLLRTLRELGVELAIDDFGTGYSSLSYLKRFPLSTVKIDRSFISDLSQDPDSQALIDGIITRAHGLRMKVVAEGVETDAQLDYLYSRGCDEIQGYWLCRPVPADEAQKFMARHLRDLLVSPVAA